MPALVSVLESAGKQKAPRPPSDAGAPSSDDDSQAVTEALHTASSAFFLQDQTVRAALLATTLLEHGSAETKM